MELLTIGELAQASGLSRRNHPSVRRSGDPSVDGTWMRRAAKPLGQARHHTTPKSSVSVPVPYFRGEQDVRLSGTPKRAQGAVMPKSSMIAAAASAALIAVILSACIPFGEQVSHAP